MNAKRSRISSVDNSFQGGSETAAEQFPSDNIGHRECRHQHRRRMAQVASKGHTACKAAAPHNSPADRIEDDNTCALLAARPGASIRSDSTNRRVRSRPNQFRKAEDVSAPRIALQ
jgi:hypothetical protein